MKGAVIVLQSSLDIADQYRVREIKGQFHCGRILWEHLNKQDNSGETGGIVINQD